MVTTGVLLVQCFHPWSLPIRVPIKCLLRAAEVSKRPLISRSQPSCHKSKLPMKMWTYDPRGCRFLDFGEKVHGCGYRIRTASGSADKFSSIQNRDFFKSTRNSSYYPRMDQQYSGLYPIYSSKIIKHFILRHW